MTSLLDKNPKILVIGDLMVDQYFWGSCNRISPEAPVQVVDVNHQTSVLGGAGNVVNNLKHLGAEVDILSVNCFLIQEAAYSVIKNMIQLQFTTSSQTTSPPRMLS